MISAVRSFFYKLEWCKKPTRLPVPVVSVGNISLGGTGKSPMAMLLLSWAKKEGFYPLILTRGYKRSSRDLVVSLGNQKLPEASQVGDEPWMIKNRFPEFPLLVHADRVSKAHENWEKFSNIDFAILDDGFQHWKAFRDFDIVMIDATEGIDGLTIPFGFFRERKSALGRANLIVINRADEISKDQLLVLEENIKRELMSPYRAKWQNSSITSNFLVKSSYKVSHFFHPASDQIVSGLNSKNVVVASGIAKSESFYRSLQSLGYLIREKIAYSDHSDLSDERKESLFSMLSRNSGSDLVLTEKDWSRWASKLYHKNIYVMCVDLYLSNEDQKTFENFLGVLKKCIT